MANRSKATPNKKADFLEQLSKDANVSRSCEAVDLARSTVYIWRRENAEFAEEWDKAVEMGVGGLEDEAVRRALKGSDTLLIFLLKGNRPEKYSERIRQEVAQSGELTIRIERTDDAED